MSEFVTRRDDDGLVREVRDDTAMIDLRMIRDSTRQRICSARCGRDICQGTTYAIVANTRRDTLQRYHWECTPNAVTKLLPFFFPEQEWKDIEEPEPEAETTTLTIAANVITACACNPIYEL